MGDCRYVCMQKRGRFAEQRGLRCSLGILHGKTVCQLVMLPAAVPAGSVCLASHCHLEGAAMIPAEASAAARRHWSARQAGCRPGLDRALAQPFWEGGVQSVPCAARRGCSSPAAGTDPVQQRIACQLHVIAGAGLEAGRVGGPNNGLAHRSSRCSSAANGADIPSEGRNAVQCGGRAPFVRRGLPAAVNCQCGASARAMQTFAAHRGSCCRFFRPPVIT